MTRPSMAHDADPEAFADAMMLCQGYAPACSDAGECLDSGRCFSSDGRGFRSAVRALDCLIEKTSDKYARSWLAIAKNAMEHQRRVETA